MKSSGMTSKIKPIEQLFSVIMFRLDYAAQFSFELANEFLVCVHSNEIHCALVSTVLLFFSQFSLFGRISALVLLKRIMN